MVRKYILSACALGMFALAAASLTNCQAGGDKKDQPKKWPGIWTDTSDPSLPADFKFQGEYVGGMQRDKKLGCQIIALGKGEFQAVCYPGGLPGDGWDGSNKSLLEGKLEGDIATFKSATGKRKYLAQSPAEFSATAAFPPKGHKEYTAILKDGVFEVKTEEGVYPCKKVERKSPTLGMKAPEGAVVLFDGSDTAQWNGGRIDKATGCLNTDGNDLQSKKKFQNYTVHAEFLLPYCPNARSQGRGNSGFYMVHHYEVQILDSFGLEGKDNECGGVYTKVTPKLNMCLPPLAWQTYDIDFTCAEVKDGKKIAPARITAKLNGVVIHDNAAIAGVTGGSRNEPEGTPGPFILQGHGNPLQFKNIWVVEKK